VRCCLNYPFKRELPVIINRVQNKMFCDMLMLKTVIWHSSRRRGSLLRSYRCLLCHYNSRLRHNHRRPHHVRYRMHGHSTRNYKHGAKACYYLFMFLLKFLAIIISPLSFFYICGTRRYSWFVFHTISPLRCF